jgi:hypothetical protein
MSHGVYCVQEESTVTHQVYLQKMVTVMQVCILYLFMNNVNGLVLTTLMHNPTSPNYRKKPCISRINLPSKGFYRKEVRIIYYDRFWETFSKMTDVTVQILQLGFSSETLRAKGDVGLWDGVSYFHWVSVILFSILESFLLNWN